MKYRIIDSREWTTERQRIWKIADTTCPTPEFMTWSMERILLAVRLVWGESIRQRVQAGEHRIAWKP